MAFDRGLPFKAILLALGLGHAAAAQAGERIVIGVSPALTAALTVIAQQQGYFARQGVDVEVRVIESGSRAVAMMLNGELDVSESTPFLPVKTFFARRDLRIYAQVSVAGNDNMIVARRDRGIRTLADLRGKRVGVLKGGFPNYVLDLMLLGAGLDASKVRLVPEENSRLAPMLVAGALDAACLYGGWADTAAAGLGGDAIVFHDEGIVRVTVVHTAKVATLERNPELFARILRAYVQAEAYVRKHPEAALKAVVRHLGLELAPARKVWKPAMTHVALEQALVKDMENLAQWLVETGQVKPTVPPNVLELIHFDSLTRVDPKRVTIIH
jgi:NitT/TauT family transport system substrate-binding protein